jgi:putative tryptophan/tyrosine transport system substrate-binding protein
MYLGRGEAMRRREFIAFLSSTAAAWPLAAAHAQRGESVRRIGVLMNRAASDPVGQARVAAFKQGMQQLGWSEGRNIQIDVRWGEDDLDLEQKNAAQLIALALDIIFASGTLSVSALRHLNRTVPIVFAYVADPLGAGFVDSLNQPGGNTTGFMAWEYSLSGKWVELLKEIAPNVTRVAVIRNPDNPVGIALFGAIQAEARSHRVDVSPIDSRLDAAAIELAIRNFARSPNSGVIMNPDAAAMQAGAGYKLVIALAAELKLPTIYPYPNMVAAGGLICHAIDPVDDSRRAAEYVDRVLKGVKPGDLPVQATKYQIVINLKTAKALGLTVPAALLAQADQVIE